MADERSGEGEGSDGAKWVRKMNVFRAFPMAMSALFMLAACGSDDDKVRIRQSLSAFNEAAAAHPPDRQLVYALELSVDGIKDDGAREAFAHCQRVLQIYQLKLESSRLTYQKDLEEMGGSKAKEALAKSKKENHPPDPEELAACQSRTLPALAK